MPIVCRSLFSSCFLSLFGTKLRHFPCVYFCCALLQWAWSFLSPHGHMTPFLFPCTYRLPRHSIPQVALAGGNRRRAEDPRHGPGHRAGGAHARRRVLHARTRLASELWATASVPQRVLTGMWLWSMFSRRLRVGRVSSSLSAHTMVLRVAF